MDTNVYEVLLNLPTLQVESVEIDGQTIRFYCCLRSCASRCPSCGSSCKKVNQYTERELRDLDISGRKVYLMLRLRQYECPCGRYFVEEVDLADPNKGYTKRQAKWVFELSAKQPFTEVGALVDMGAKTVERIFYDEARLDGHGRYDGVEELGIDEISFSKGKKDYLCVLTNLRTGGIVDILRTRDKAALIDHFSGVRLQNGQLFALSVKKISCDFWGPFMDIAQKHFPNATVFGDRFHWTVYLNKVLDSTRKALRKALPKEDAFKRIKWLLFKQAAQTTQEQREQLEPAFKLSPPLEELYELVKTFVAIFEAGLEYNFALQQVRHWVEHAKTIGNKALDDFLAFLDRNFESITNCLKHPVSNAVTEGNNNLIRTVKRFTFNMTNFDHFKARCFAMKTSTT